jgi:hypothetical protein
MDRTSIVLKQDTLGRVHTPLERREALVTEFRRSGLSAVQFSKLVGVRYSTFWTWLRHFDRGLKAPSRMPGGKPKFVEVCVDPTKERSTTPPAGLHISLPGGAQLTICDAVEVSLAAQLIKALGTPC